MVKKKDWKIVAKKNWKMIAVILIAVFCMGVVTYSKSVDEPYWESWQNPPPAMTVDEYLEGNYSDEEVLLEGEITYLGSYRSDDPTGLFEVELEGKVSFRLTWDAEVLECDVGDMVWLLIDEGQYEGLESCGE